MRKKNIRIGGSLGRIGAIYFHIISPDASEK